ncbi:MAG: translation initiation factor IF-2, partial [Candidatus Thermoplasmatota archaeon]|nr:translation initiation factor IF-2 [Candidatus Thermoplasmatota archaeon]
MAAPPKYVRQPIVSVLGHVDHGKTSLLDFIRGSTVAARESGAITQHIGATEVPIDAIYQICGSLLKEKKFTLPGLLFIDTPGHHAFTALRTRGGSLADIAILIVDVTEGFKPQTYESLNILKQYKTPFIIVANKIDAISGWQKQKEPLAKMRINSQRVNVKTHFEERIYELIGTISEHKLNADLYYNINDFRKTIGIVPLSAKTGEGIPELLMVLVGLAQRFLENKLHIESGPGKGSVLEVKEEVGLGKTIDAIIYNGTIKNDDRIVIGTTGEPVVTHIKALLKPKPLDEIRDPRERFDNVSEVHAACGIKISSPDIDNVIPGAPIRVAAGNLEEVIKEIKDQTKIDFELDEQGIIVKADTIGSLEALIKESGEKGIRIRKAEIGNVSKRDIIEADATVDPLHKLIFAFNVKILPEAKEELAQSSITLFHEDVIYTIMEKYDEWIELKKAQLEQDRRKEYIHPGMIRFLPEYVFRVSHPAVIGVRVLSGRIKMGMRLMKVDGKVIGSIKGIQSENKPVDEALQGQEVAISIEGVTVGRQIKGEDI